MEGPLDRDSARAEARGAKLALFVLAAAYLVLWAALAGLPFQDVPNHVARAVVIGDLLFDGGRRFGEHFTFDWQAVPYILGDLLMLPFARWLPADVAGRVLVVLEWVSLPAAVAFLLYAWRAPRATWLIGLALSLYLATDLFFVLGFAAFRLAIALVLASLAAWELASRTGMVRWWLGYFALAGLGYLTHLSALVFLVAAVGILSALRLVERREQLGRLLLAGLPLLLLLAWHLLGREPLNAAPPLQPSAELKLLRLAAPLARFGQGAVGDVALLVVFAAMVTVVALAAARRGATVVERELAVLTVAFLGIYFVLPEEQGLIWAIDSRALTLVWLWLALLAAFAAPRIGWTRPLAVAALGIAAANVAVLAAHLLPEDRAMREYRELAAHVPYGAVVLPVTTRPKRGFTNPTAHAASFAMLDRDAIVPYTFSGDVGMPMTYFRFRHRPEAPPQFWYQTGWAPEKVRDTMSGYRYLLVELPADWSRIPVSGRVTDRNGTAALVETRAAVAQAQAPR
jgi:hypothetical protein